MSVAAIETMDATSESQSLSLPDDVSRRLLRGGTAVDLRSGDGAAAIALARAFPRARVFGFDVRPDRVAVARRRALAAGVGGRVRFAAIDWRRMPAYGFDLVISFDLVLTSSESSSALADIERALTPGGCYLAFECAAGEDTPRVRMFKSSRRT